MTIQQLACRRCLRAAVFSSADVGSNLAFLRRACPASSSEQLNFLDGKATALRGGSAPPGIASKVAAWGGFIGKCTTLQEAEQIAKEEHKCTEHL